MRYLFDLPIDGEYTKISIFITWLMIASVLILISLLVLEIWWSSIKYKSLIDIKNLLLTIKIWTDTAKAYSQEAKNIHEKTTEKVDIAKEEIKKTVVAKVEEIKDQVTQQSIDISNLPQK